MQVQTEIILVLVPEDSHLIEVKTEASDSCEFKPYAS